jgi:hypothetical protein
MDWSWGKIYAIDLKAKGASYVGTKTDFIGGAPLPVTDLLIHPQDGAMYFAIGGRKVQSGLYRVTYAGKESTEPVLASTAKVSPEVAVRKALEQFHGKQDAKAADALLAIGESKRDATIPAAEHAALTATCLALYNLDAAITRD